MQFDGIVLARDSNPPGVGGGGGVLPYKSDGGANRTF